MPRNSFLFWCFLGLVVVLPSIAMADKSKADGKKPSKKSVSKNSFSIEITEEVRDALMPLIDSIAEAKVSRATVRMLTDSVMSGEVVESREATFQIAAKNPGKFTVYLKEPEQRTRVYCDGKRMVAAMAPDAFFRLSSVPSIQDAVTSLSVPLGPYPEPLLALTLAGCDPKITFVAAMKSIEVTDRKPFKGKIPAIHLHGVQSDAVTWDLWVSDDQDDPQPLRLLVDMTPMLAASDQVHVPAGFSYQVRYDFLTWRVKGELKDDLFTFKPGKSATEYKSLEDYFQQIAGAKGYHPLLGQKAPSFTTTTVGQRKFDLKSLKGRVVVVDFWTTTCKACLAGMPTVKKVTDRYAKKGVVLLQINTGQDAKTVKRFLKDTGIKMNFLMDEDGKIADGFVADAIPQTVLIGKDGIVESVHLGFAGKEALEKRLTDELDVLTIGGRIASTKSKQSKSK